MWINVNNTNSNNILYSSQREIKAVVRSYTLTDKEKVKFVSTPTHTYAHTSPASHPAISNIENLSSNNPRFIEHLAVNRTHTQLRVT